MGEEDVPTHLCLFTDLSLWVTIPILPNFSSICVKGEIIWCVCLGSLLDLSFPSTLSVGTAEGRYGCSSLAEL